MWDSLRPPHNCFLWKRLQQKHTLYGPETIREFITVAEDIEYLGRVWLADPPLDEVRRGSALLRRLLLDGVFHEAWRELGWPKQAVIPSPNLSAILSDLTQPIEVALAGGATYRGVQAAGATIVRGKRPPRAEQSRDLGQPLGHPYPLSQFVESPAAIVQNQTIRRRELIRYFALYAGGVHLERSARARKKDDELIARIERLKGRVEIAQVDGLVFELLSIGQHVALAPDAVRLAKEIRARAV